MKRFLVVGGVVVAVLLAVALPVFEPWRAFTSSTIDEAPPTADPSTTTSSATPGSTAGSTPEAAPADTVLATGSFVDAEHGTSGTARILQLADGRRFLRIEDLATSDGPDLHVWLSEARSGGGWGSYDDGREVRLGDLKATHGNQNYPIPADADLTGMRSVVIWCDRFNVAFGTAALPGLA